MAVNNTFLQSVFLPSTLSDRELWPCNHQIDSYPLSGTYCVLLTPILSTPILSPPRLERWKKNDYVSKNISPSSDDEEEEEEEEEGVDIQYMVGDVTRPQCAGTEDAIVVHCVGVSIM